jgi:hypothetical protein
VAEIAERVGSTVEQVLEAMQAATARHATSLDRPRRDSDGPGSDGLEIAIDEPAFAVAEDAVLLESLMRDLTQREQLVLNLRFREDLTQSQIAEIVNLSQMHVSRVIRATLDKLQTAARPASPTDHTTRDRQVPLSRARAGARGGRSISASERTLPTSSTRIGDDELAAILARAARAGIAPQRVLLALGLRATTPASSGASQTRD